MATTSSGPNLTPFGYTPTESLAYFRLLSRGPSSGYAIARELSIARANAYQALHGLVSKGAAITVGERPLRFRAVRPDSVYARIVEHEAHKLNELEAQLASAPQSAAEGIVPIASVRALVELATRVLVRETKPVACVAESGLLRTLVPALRKRAADGAPTLLWSVGDPPELPLPAAGSVDSARWERLFGSAVVLMVTGQSALVAQHRARDVRGFWATDPLLVGAARGAYTTLTGSELEYDGAA
ncbi:MAG: hypothetical protein HY560_11730 [Gemmatimonadetes bacterium]|nr:hypothetical protein [Gemmatimonadota bacterium]